MSKRLTAEMIIKRARGISDLSSIRKLNFWGQSLGDISVLSQCISLESATFSQNCITSLKCFQGMNYLRELSLAKNSIKDFREVAYLGTCQNLIKLWLKDNPISKIWDYRIQVIKLIPQLKYLDDEEITPDERQIANTGSFFQNNYDVEPKYEQKRANVRAPSYEPFNAQQRFRNNNFQQYGGVYNRERRDFQSNDTDYYNYMGDMPGMVEENRQYLNSSNRYGRYQKRKADTPGKSYERKGSARRGVTPYNNNNYHYEPVLKKANSNNVIAGKNVNYNPYGRNIPGSAQSHYRRYGNNNQMEVSTTTTQQGQKGIVDCVSVLLKGLSNDELLYIVEHIDKKISKI